MLHTYSFFENASRVMSVFNKFSCIKLTLDCTEFNEDLQALQKVKYTSPNGSKNMHRAFVLSKDNRCLFEKQIYYTVIYTPIVIVIMMHLLYLLYGSVVSFSSHMSDISYQYTQHVYITIVYYNRILTNILQNTSSPCQSYYRMP